MHMADALLRARHTDEHRSRNAASCDPMYLAGRRPEVVQPGLEGTHLFGGRKVHPVGDDDVGHGRLRTDRRHVYKSMWIHDHHQGPNIQARRKRRSTKGVDEIRGTGQPRGLHIDAIRVLLVEDPFHGTHKALGRRATHAAAPDLSNRDRQSVDLMFVYRALSEVVHHDSRALLGSLLDEVTQYGRFSGAEKPGDHMYGNPALHPCGLTCDPMTRWFITGTDTGVGKTVVTACLAEAASGTVRALKPIESGIVAGQTYGDDAKLLGTAAGHPPMCALGLTAAVSPHRAAKLEGRPVDIGEISRWIAQVHGDTVLVEGAGGWRVPWVQDLCRATAGRVLVVAANRLGVINHTRLTVEAISRDGFDVAAVILNACGKPVDASTATNLEDLTDLLSVPVIPLGLVEPDNATSRARCGGDLWRALS